MVKMLKPSSTLLKTKELLRVSRKKDPKKGTGKKPKGSGRRLYTDENPKDTVSIKFATVADAKATIAKVKRIKKPYARNCLLYTSPSPRDKRQSRMPSSA